MPSDQPPAPPSRPIGYWVKAADDALTRWLEITTRGPSANQGFQLSAVGHAQQAAILRRQEEIQRQVADGISPEELATTVRVLERLVANISSAEGGGHDKPS